MTKTLTDGCQKVSMYRRTVRVKQPNRLSSIIIFTWEIVPFDDTSNVTVLSDNVFTKIWNRSVSSTSLCSDNKCLSRSVSLISSLSRSVSLSKIPSVMVAMFYARCCHKCIQMSVTWTTTFIVEDWRFDTQFLSPSFAQWLGSVHCTFPTNLSGRETI